MFTNDRPHMADRQIYSITYISFAQFMRQIYSQTLVSYNS